jgi:hypothetical protein
VTFHMGEVQFAVPAVEHVVHELKAADFKVLRSKIELVVYDERHA